MNKAKHSVQRQHEYALYRYHKALERGDFEAIAALLKQAQHDSLLNHMIAELDSALESDSEREIRYAEWQAVSPIVYDNGEPSNRDINQEKATMTTQAGYWEPRQATGGTNRFAATMVLLIAALVVGGIFLFMLPSHSGIMTLIGQQPTPTAADIAKLYVEELWGKGNQDLVKTLMAADFVDHDPMFVNNGRVVSANDKNNSAVFTYNIEILGRTFPDLSVKTEDVVEGNDRVVVRWTFTGTSTGTFITYTGTDKRVTMTNTDILRIMDGKIVERWGVNRLASLMEAMDVVTVTQPVAEAVSAFARFAYMYSANTIDDLGEAFGDQVEFNGDALSLKDFKVVVADAYKALDGISNIRITSATVIGNRLLADIEFDTSNGIIHNKGYVVINLKDGKIATYDFYGR